MSDHESADGGQRQADGELDCMTCSACCRVAGPGHILVPLADIVRWQRTGRADLVASLVEGHFSEAAFPSRSDGACLHLGTDASPHACSIYAERGTTCREFEKGSAQCRSYRREAGIEPALPRRS